MGALTRRLSKTSAETGTSAAFDYNNTLLNKTLVGPAVASHEAATLVTEATRSPRPTWLPTQRTFCTHITMATRAHGMELAAGAEIYYSAQGRLISIFIAEDTLTFGTTYPAASLIYFNPEGGLDWVSLSDTTTINSFNLICPEIPAARMVSFYRNGQVKETTLSDKLYYQELMIPPQSLIHFSNAGQLVWCHLSTARDWEIGSSKLAIAAATCVEFHHEGSIRSAVLAETRSIQGHTFPAGVRVHFDPAGQLALAQLNLERPGRPRRQVQTLRFDREGSIKEITVS